MREKLAKFMYGRYGADDLSKFLFYSTLFFWIFSTILGMFRADFLSTLCYWIGLGNMIYSYVRIFSRNIPKRYDENQKFLFKKATFMRKFNSEKSIMSQRKDFHFYRCPKCTQRIRIPRGKGRIEIRCPKCSTTFIKKS